MAEISCFGTEGEGPDQPYVERYADPLLGWGPRTTGGLEAIDVPGGHSSMLQEPHVRTLAASLQRRIDEALADGGGEDRLDAARRAPIQ